MLRRSNSFVGFSISNCRSSGHFFFRMSSNLKKRAPKGKLADAIMSNKDVS